MTIVKHTDRDGRVIYGIVIEEHSEIFQIIPSVLAVPENESPHNTLQCIMNKRYTKPFDPYLIVMKHQCEMSEI